MELAQKPHSLSYASVKNKLMNTAVSLPSHLSLAWRRRLWITRLLAKLILLPLGSSSSMTRAVHSVLHVHASNWDATADYMTASIGLYNMHMLVWRATAPPPPPRTKGCGSRDYNTMSCIIASSMVTLSHAGWVYSGVSYDRRLNQLQLSRFS